MTHRPDPAPPSRRAGALRTFALTCALALTCTLAAPLAAPAQNSVAGIPASERGIVQAALALTRDYDGLIDGVWGPRSERAFTTWRSRMGLEDAPVETALAQLLTGYREEWEDSGWAFVTTGGERRGFVAPVGRLEDPAGFDPGRDLWEARTADGRLLLEGSANAVGLGITRRHEELLALHRGEERPYALRRDRLKVTSVETGADGATARVYFRSDGPAGNETSIRVEGRHPGELGRMQLVASSIGGAAARPLAPPGTGPLFALMGPRPEAVAQGVHVGPGEIVTAAAVLKGCAAPLLVDGTPLELRASDDGSGLALLRASPGTGVPVALAASGGARLGAPMTVVLRRPGTAEPDRLAAEVVGISSASLSIASGAGDGAEAPPPGFFALGGADGGFDPGAAVLDAGGALAGIVSEPADGSGGGRVATSLAGLRGFLDAAGIDGAGPAPDAPPPPPGHETGASFVRILCRAG